MNVFAEDHWCSVCFESDAILHSANTGTLSDDILAILKPVTCTQCSTRLADLECLRVHQLSCLNSGGQSVDTRQIVVKNLSAKAIKAYLVQFGQPVTGKKDVLAKRLESFLSHRS